MCNEEYAIRNTNPYDLLAVSMLKKKITSRLNPSSSRPIPSVTRQNGGENGVMVIKPEKKD